MKFKSTIQRFFTLLSRRVTGDWWVPVVFEGKWGVYHPVNPHKWTYPYDSFFQAAKVCRELNYNS